jgi:hypothetical protein
LSRRRCGCTRLRENALAIGLVVLGVVRAHLGTAGRVLSAQALGREDGLTVGLARRSTACRQYTSELQYDWWEAIAQGGEYVRAKIISKQ